MTAATDTPLWRYFRFHEGRWRGTFTFRITDREAFARADLPMVDRARLRAMAAFGTTRLDTAVTCGEREIVHVTRFSSLGLPAVAGREVITPTGDATGALRIEHRFPPLFLLRTWDDGTVRIADAGDGATYELPWIGGRLTQTTRVVPEGLRLEQVSPFSRGEVLLRRR